MQPDSKSRTRVVLRAGARPRARCGKTAVFAGGRCNRPHSVAWHEAVDEGQIAGRNASSYPAINPGSRRVPLSIAFSDPQMAIAGASYDSLDRADIETGAASFADQGRARILAANRGLLHVYARRGRRQVAGRRTVRAAD